MPNAKCSMSPTKPRYHARAAGTAVDSIACGTATLSAHLQSPHPATALAWNSCNEALAWNRSKD
jgi:hypothetical protein